MVPLGVSANSDREIIEILLLMQLGWLRPRMCKLLAGLLWNSFPEFLLNSIITELEIF